VLWAFWCSKRMPKRKRKILMGIHHPLESPQFNWQLIEETYARRLDQTVRQKIQEVTVEFASDAIFELTVASVDAARKEIESILSAAEQLRDAIPEPSATVDGASYARHLLVKHIRDPALPVPTVMPYRDPIRVFSRIVTSCVTACQRSLEELDDPDWSIEEGEAWERWINRLTSVLAAANLPTAARKDDAEPSAFVSLVDKLQACLPPKCQRPVQSHQALATAIARARVTKA
jgi:hypothetical protein